MVAAFARRSLAGALGRQQWEEEQGDLLMRIPYSRVLGVVCGLAGVGAIATLGAPGIGVAVVAFLVAVTAMSAANRIASSLVGLVGKRVVVEVWGAPIPVTGDRHLVVQSVTAFGAGLLIRLRATADAPGVLLKVAQPKAAIVSETGAEIHEAAYVSWAGTKLTRGAGGEARAVIIRLDSTAATGGSDPIAPRGDV